MSTTTTGAPFLEEVWRLSDGELAAALAEREAVRRRAQADMSVLIGELERRGSESQSRARQVMRDELHLSNHAIRRQFSRADVTQPHPTLGQREATVLLPGTRDAVRRAEINGEHVDELARIFRHSPDWLSIEDRSELEEELLLVARTSPPEALRKQGDKLIALWDSDGQPPSDDDLTHPHRELRCHRRKRDGALTFTGVLDSETGDTLEGLLGALAKPLPTTDGQRDKRSRAERDGDALAEIIGAAARADDSTVQGGESAVLIVTATLEDLQTTTRQALLDVPGCTSVESLRRLACDARLVPAIFNAAGEPLYLGRSYRHANTAQRRALAVRDNGCGFPGCTRPPKWTQPHHILGWAVGGPTDVDSLVLLCAAHHRVIHHGEWEVRSNPTDHRPEFIPPAHVDARRRPLRNHAHGPPRQLYQRFCREPRQQAVPASP